MKRVASRHGVLGMMIALAMAFAATSAQAIYVDFADYVGAASGNSADIEVGGQSITISSMPSSFDLTIGRDGLGVECTAGFVACLSNSDSQLDAEWNESLTITFNDGPVSLNSVVLSQVFLGEVALVTAGDAEHSVTGSAWRARDATATVDLSGLVVDQLVFSTQGWLSDASVRGIDFDLVSGSTGGSAADPRPASAIPEPGAALLFAAGLTVVGGRARRGVQDGR